MLDLFRNEHIKFYEALKACFWRLLAAFCQVQMQPSSSGDFENCLAPPTSNITFTLY